MAPRTRALWYEGEAKYFFLETHCRTRYQIQRLGPTHPTVFLLPRTVSEEYAASTSGPSESPLHRLRVGQGTFGRHCRTRYQIQRLAHPTVFLFRVRSARQFCTIVGERS